MWKIKHISELRTANQLHFYSYGNEIAFDSIFMEIANKIIVV